eukprot:SM000004S15038  [mRNA]  locus=s4:900874:901487:+ [translate_table: standard]
MSSAVPVLSRILRDFHPTPLHSLQCSDWEHVYSLAHKGEAIGVDAATGKRDEAVTFRHAAAVNHSILLDCADCKAAEDTATSSSVAPGKAAGSDPTAAFKIYKYRRQARHNLASNLSTQLVYTWECERQALNLQNPD